MKKAIIISTLALACKTPPRASITPSPVTTVNPPPPEIPPPPDKIKPPNILHSLPTWDDISAPEGLSEPFAILALSTDGSKCYKEWHTKSSLSANVIENGGRILSAQDKIIGRLIQCPVDIKKRILQGNH